MGKGPSEWSQSIPKSERCLDIYHIQTDLELVRPGHNVKFNYSNSLADGIFECSDRHRLSLHISMPQPQGLYTAQRAFKPLPLSICRYFRGPTRHQNRKRVRLLRLCPQLVGQSWKRKRYGVSLLGTMSRRKGGDVLIPPPIKHTSRRMLSLMRHHHGGLPRM
jgi:hypothetical protein